MARLKTTVSILLFWTCALAALGIFASVGLAVLGGLAILGLVIAAAAWISQTLAAPRQSEKSTA